MVCVTDRRVCAYDIDLARVTNDDEQTNKTGTTENTRIDRGPTAVDSP
jgi:hypothetical protein